LKLVTFIIPEGSVIGNGEILLGSIKLLIPLTVLTLDEIKDESI
jgi:hypothetical protein